MPIGGSGVLSDALARCIEDNGGTIRTECSVKSFKISGNECTGVILESGEEVDATKAVVSNLNIKQMFPAFPRRYRSSYSGWKRGGVAQTLQGISSKTRLDPSV